jgi:all-trans-retinol 13,14-reductase
LKSSEKTYDFVIIGGGLGGLVCAAILSKNGYKVLVLDKNKQLGGNLQVFTRENKIFDTGVHYIGSLDEGQNLNLLFKYLGILDQINIEKMDPAFDKIHFHQDEKYFEFHQGYQAFIDGLVKEFPNEELGINKYVDEIKEICDFFPFYRLKNTSADYFQNEKIYTNAYDHIASLIQDEKLQNILAGAGLLYGGIREKTPFYVHALVINSYMESSFRCINGGSQIAIQLSKVIHQHGGTILKKKEVVSSIFEENKLIQSVTTADGDTYYGKNFISNIHPKQGLSIFGEKNFKKAYVNRINNLENSISSFSVHLSLKDKMIPYQNFNIYQHNSTETWGHEKYTEENWPLSYLLSMSPNQRNQKWADSMSVLSYMRYDEVKQWANTKNLVDQPSDRTVDYHVFKKRKEEKIIEDLKKLFPNIEDCIEAVYSSTPLTFRDYIGTEDGSMYGILKDHENPLKTLISSRTKVKNLFLTGQNLNLHGVLGVTISAFLTSFNFVDKDQLIEEIHHE